MNFALIARRTFLTGLVGLSLSGCIMVPTPEHGQLGPRDPIKRDLRNWLSESKPTREEILFVLGGPETHTIDGQKCVYTWARIGGYWMAGGAGEGAAAAGAAGPIESRHFLVVTFDENNRVETVEEPDRTLFSGFKSWNTDEGSLLKSPSELELGNGWIAPDPTAQIDAVRFNMRARWWANSEGYSWRYVMSGDTGESGHLTLTDRTIEFRVPSHSVEEERLRSFAYSELAECRLRSFGRVLHVVIRTRADEVHAFTTLKQKGFGLLWESKENEAVCAFIQARIAEQGGTQSE